MSEQDFNLYDLEEKTLDSLLNLPELSKSKYINELIERFYPTVNRDEEMYADLQLSYRSSWLVEKVYRANPVFKESFTFVYTKTGLVRNMISDLYFTDDHLITH
jgi:hypothetical protein